MINFGPSRAWLILGRVSNLPTVWSNCIAGWLLAGGGSVLGVVLVTASGSLFYIGGMFLNDACDARFDAEYRSERPIPKGEVGRTAVIWAGIIFLGAGLAMTATLGRHTALLGFFLTALILLYDVSHKKISFSPVIMGACRTVLLLMAASFGTRIGLSVIAYGLSLGLYIIGVSLLARTESRISGLNAYWASLLFAPILVVNVLSHSLMSAFYSLPLLCCILLARRKKQQSIGGAVALLLAAIPLADLLAVAPVAVPVLIGFSMLFTLTLFLQRYIPST